MKTFNKILKRLIIILLIIPFLQACDYSYLELEELPDYEYSSVWVAPILKSTMTIDNIFIESGEETLIVDDEDLVWLIYDGELFSVDGQTAYNLPDQNFDYSFSYDGTKSFSSKAVETITFNSEEDEELTLLSFRGGNMEITANSPQLVIDGGEIEITGTILDSDDGSGNPISFTFSLTESAVIDLTDNVLNFGDNQTLDIQLDVELVSGSPSNPPYTIEINQQFTNLEFLEIQGYLKQRSFILGSDSIDLDFFKNVVDGEIFFEDPLIEIIADNSYGIPFNIHFDAFFSTNDDQTVDLEGNPITEVPSTPWLIDYPSVENSGDIVTTQHDLDKNNSNIHEIMEILPQRVGYEIRGETNPEGDADLNFVRYDSQFSIDVTVNLPFHGRLNLAGFRDTVDLELPDVEQIEWIEMIVNIVNGMPFSSYLLLDIVDEDYNLLKTVFHPDQAVILSSGIDQDGNATTPTTATSTVRLDRDELDGLEAAKYIIVRARVTSYGDGERNIKIYSKDELSVYIAVKAGIYDVIDFDGGEGK
ncbi:MAG: hypothetical protein ACOCWC_01545 [Bacteroidota bacterium]